MKFFFTPKSDILRFLVKFQKVGVGDGDGDGENFFMGKCCENEMT